LAKVKLDFGAELDFLSPAEFGDGLRKGLADGWAAEQEERGRGMKYLEFAGNLNGVTVNATTAVVLTPSGDSMQYTPESGYVWRVGSVGFQTPTSAIANLWKVSDPNSTTPPFNKILGRDTANTIHNFLFGSGQVFLFPGQYLAVNTQAASTVNPYYFSVCQVPIELQWKLM
jgi:hypothetical protein